MSHSTLFIISRFSPSSLVNNHTIATTSFSFKLARKALKSPPDPGRYSRYVSMSHSHLSPGIPHPSTHTIKPKANPQTFEDTSKPRPVHRRVQYRTRELPEIKVGSRYLRGILYRLPLTWHSHWQTRWPIFVALGVGALSIWGVFLLYTTNQERLSSSVIRQFILKLKRTQNPEVLESLGTNVTLQPVWWMFNEPYINGQVRSIAVSCSITCGCLYHLSFLRSICRRGTSTCRCEYMDQKVCSHLVRLLAYTVLTFHSTGAGTLYFTSVRREKAAPFTIRTSHLLSLIDLTLSLTSTPS